MLLRLRRAGVPVLWAARVLALDGDGRVAAARSPAGGERTIAADVVALNLGFQPEVGLARALGVPHRFVDVGLGHLATETDDDGRTAVAGVFAVGDGAALGGARVALARGRLAGLAAARDLGLAAPEDPAARAARGAGAGVPGRAVAAVPRRRRSIPTRSPMQRSSAAARKSPPAQLRAEIAGGLASLAALKKATRAGMGRCQGRFCAATVARLCPDAPGADGVRRAARAGAAGAGGASDVRGAGIQGAAAGRAGTAQRR